jgi:hypothetical protein
MTIADQLRVARKLIETPDKWCKGSMELDGAFCAIGACLKAVGGSAPWDKMVIALQQALQQAGPCASVALWNDALTTTHTDILALFDRAIAAAEKKEK